VLGLDRRGRGRAWGEDKKRILWTGE